MPKYRIRCGPVYFETQTVKSLGLLLLWKLYSWL